jgi:predicted aldo/keto reductase-like oxidoreductase
VNPEKPDGDATLCTECMECVEKCPQGIMIPEELEKVHAIMKDNEEVAQHFSQT